MTKIVNPIIVTSGGGDSAEKLKQLASGTLTELTAKDLDGVTAIDEYFCYHNPTLTKIEIPDSVTTLNQYAFYRCEKVSEVTIGMNVASIKDSFKSCPNLTKITFRGTINQFLQYSFEGANISIVDFRNSTAIPTMQTSNGFLGTHASGCKIIVPDDLYDSWQTATNWSALTDVVWVKASEYVEE